MKSVMTYVGIAVGSAFSAGLVSGFLLRKVPEPPPPPPAPTCAQIQTAQVTETCMAWWFQSNPGELAKTRKRVCGR